jgi:phospholipid/cholesterol/gamma-HCH transport system ATP-binding protein
MDGLLRIEALTVRFGATLVLDEVTLDFPTGQTTAVMGASGGGKTTLLRCLAGLMRPSSGKVLFKNEDIGRLGESRMLPFRRRMGFVFQYAALFDYLTVQENVAFGVERLLGLRGKKLSALVDEKLKLVGLEGKGGLYPDELSGGMRKRVGLARAIAPGPEVLFYDEPTSGLDPVTAYSIDYLITDMKRRLGVTSVVVSHDVNSVFRVADRIAVLAAGKVIELGDRTTIMNSRAPEVVDLLRAYRTDTLEGYGG